MANSWLRAVCGSEISQAGAMVEVPQIRVSEHRCKKRFLRFLFWSRFFTFLTFYFLNGFLFLKNVGKVQSGKQINSKHFQNNSNEIDL